VTEFSLHIIIRQGSLQENYSVDAPGRMGD